MAEPAPPLCATQLWSKGEPLNALIHRFTVGDDPNWDAQLSRFDCMASAAHAKMLAHAGLISTEQAVQLTTALHALFDAPIAITMEQEDCHTAIEAELTLRLGETGKRIHLGRSRNDQVLVALRLLLKQTVRETSAQLLTLVQALLDFAKLHQDVPLPGYTHLQRAMPSSFGMWAQGFAQGLLEELDASAGLLIRIDRCPLGAAAGFGVPLPLDRQFCAALLGFAQVQISPPDCMNSRGRHEQAVLDWFASIAHTLEKLAWDIVLYASQEFNFIRLPDAFTTGSSIMPQKRNPDVAELARAHCRQIRGFSDSHRHIMSGLPSSYHRDFQLGKAPLLGAIACMRTLLPVLAELVPQLQPATKHAENACSDELYAAHAAYQKVAAGAAFRVAYQEIAAEIKSGSFKPDRSALSAKHIGGLSNLGLPQSQAAHDQHAARVAVLDATAAAVLRALWE
jgi:argininosuccinate lyase